MCVLTSSELEYSPLIGEINMSATKSDQLKNAGRSWHELHTEREEVCEALLQNALRSCSSAAQVEMRRALDRKLQQRLRLIDEALDSLLHDQSGPPRRIGLSWPIQHGIHPLPEGGLTGGQLASDISNSEAGLSPLE